MPTPTEAPDRWCYISGRCASLEAALLGKEFFRDLLREGSLDAAYSRLAKSPYGALFPQQGALHEYDRLVTEDLLESLRAIGEGSPANGPAEIFIRELELREVHGVLIRQGIAGAPAQEAERWAERLGAGFGWLQGFALAGGARGLFAEQPVRALSLWADASFLIELSRIASAEPELRPYLDGAIALRVFEVCWRALREGIDERWLAAFFFREGLCAPRAGGNLAGLAADKPPRGLLRLLAPTDFTPPEDEFEERYPKEADDYLTLIAGRGRHQVYGASRVLSYARRVWVEHFNLRLCVAALIAKLPLPRVQSRLRNG